MSSSFVTMKIGIEDSDEKLFIGEQYIINFSNQFGFVLIEKDLSVRML
jgi:hypothetical protein